MNEQSSVNLGSIKFPQKLWYLVNEHQRGDQQQAIHWSNGGQTISINYVKFQKEFLNSKEPIFKTTNVASFVRQLNLYGFRKIGKNKSSKVNEQIHDFFNDNFQLNKPELLSKVSRRATTNGTVRKRSSQKKIEGKLVVDDDDAAAVSLSSNNNNKDVSSKAEQTGSRLEDCRLSLKEALKQATLEYGKKKQEMKEMQAWWLSYCNDYNNSAAYNYFNYLQFNQMRLNEFYSTFNPSPYYHGFIHPSYYYYP